MSLRCFWKLMEKRLIKSKDFHLALANLMDIFEALNDLNLISQGKNTNGIDD